MFQFPCSCGATLQARDDFAGRQVRCPRCGNVVVALDEASPPAPATPAPAGSVTDLPTVLPAESSFTGADAPPGAPPEEEMFVATPVDSARPRQAGPQWPPERSRDDRPAEPAQTSGKAVAALVLGLLGFCLPGIVSILAVIFGFLARGDIKRSGSRQGGAGMALAGVILGFVSLLMIPVTIALLLPAVQRVREAAAKTVCARNLRQVALALHDYNVAHGRLPPAVVYDNNGRPLYSWRVLLLPHLKQEALFRQFKLDEPWDSPSNRRLLQHMPEEYAHPSPIQGKDPTLTYFQVFDGPANGKKPAAIFVSKTNDRKPFKLREAKDTLTMSSHQLAFGELADDLAHTILLAEAAEGVPWTKPADLLYEPDRPLPNLGGHFGGGFHVVMADAVIRFIDPREVSEQTLRLAITADDGQRLPADWHKGR